MSKREDIQWLRALAIFAVLLFHLKPELFPFGYLGVDIFFVISGYLMTCILSKEISILSFYFSRIKRILPSYLFIITCVLGTGYYILLPSDYQALKTETIWSIFFINNFYPIFHQKQYFEMVSEYKFLLHSWSLGVEIQFYLISPFLIKFLLSRKNILLCTIFVAIFSFTLQLIVSNKEMAFGLMFCRIWQFLIGSLAFILQKGVDDYLSTNTVSYLTLPEDSCSNANKKHSPTFFAKILIFMVLVGICFSKAKGNYLFSKVLCTICTILTGMFIYWSKQNLNIFKIGNIALVYFGDISYAMYLIHWPLIVFHKYFGIAWSIYSTIILIIILTIFFHECFEKAISNRSSMFVTAFIGLSYLVIFAFLLVNQTNMAFPAAIQENEKQFILCQSVISRENSYVKQCRSNTLIEKHYKFRPSIHQYDYLNLYCSIKLCHECHRTALIMGNSFVSFEIDAIMGAIKQSKIKFSEAFVISQPICSILFGSLNSDINGCKGYNGSFDEVLKVLRPDVIIHTGRLIHNRPFAFDDYFNEIKKNIMLLSKFTNRLIIIEPIPIFDESMNFLNPSTISHALYINGSIDQFKQPIEIYKQYNKGTWKRVEEAQKYCSNCFLVSTEHLFCSKQDCPIFDPKTNISRYCDNGHITPTESLRMMPYILQAINS